MPQHDIVVIGASAGGREAISELVRRLPADLPAAVFIVWHMPSHGEGMLPHMLSKLTPLMVKNAVNGEPILRGHIYCAPVDQHLLIEADQVRTTRGPKENRFRPAIDPLFRSAAYAYGPRVIGIVLSGALNDGTSGLWAIKDRGGITLVQEPEDAQVPGMPLSALQNVDIDYRVSVSDMAAVLARLVNEPALAVGAAHMNNDKLALEVKFATDEPTNDRQLEKLGEISEFTCPECHGTLWQLFEGGMLRFRCRTGHAYTADALLDDLGQSVEAMQWAAIRGMEESATLMEHMAIHLNKTSNFAAAKRYLDEAEQTRRASFLVRTAINVARIPKSSENGGGSAPV